MPPWLAHDHLDTSLPTMSCLLACHLLTPHLPPVAFFEYPPFASLILTCRQQALRAHMVQLFYAHIHAAGGGPLAARQVDLMQLQHYCSLEAFGHLPRNLSLRLVAAPTCARQQVSSSITITDPMPCRTLTIQARLLRSSWEEILDWQAPLPNFRSSLHALIMQAPS